jgi:hypothetical protein
MNWDAISAVGEIIGAAAIVITLAYLAIQVKQNSANVKLASLESMAGQWHQWSSILAGSPDLAEIVARGNHDYPSLPEEDALRYGAFIQMFFDATESYYTQITEIGIAKDMEVLKAIVRRRLRHRGFTQWWEENAGDYESGFCRWVNGLRDEAGEPKNAR